MTRTDAPPGSSWVGGTAPATCAIIASPIAAIVRVSHPARQLPLVHPIVRVICTLHGHWPSISVRNHATDRGWRKERRAEQMMLGPFSFQLHGSR
jgi:hypothetical protein